MHLTFDIKPNHFDCLLLLDIANVVLEISDVSFNKYSSCSTGAKKEMAEAEKAAQKKLNQRTKLEHAKAYRKAKERKKPRC